MVYIRKDLLQPLHCITGFFCIICPTPICCRPGPTTHMGCCEGLPWTPIVPCILTVSGAGDPLSGDHPRWPCFSLPSLQCFCWCCLEFGSGMLEQLQAAVNARTTVCPWKLITGPPQSEELSISTWALVLPDTLVTSRVTRSCSHKVGNSASPARSSSPTLCRGPPRWVSVAHREKGSYANETQAGPGSQYPPSSQRHILFRGSIRIHSCCCWMEGRAR